MMKKIPVNKYSHYGKFTKRQKMTETLRYYGIRDPRILSAFLAIPRHRFVPADQEDQAYADTPLHIGFGQTISQPYVIAFMLEALDLKPHHHILEVGSGCGYVTALLSMLVKKVTGIELEKSLVSRSRSILKELDIKNVKIVHGDGYRGYEPNAPYDGILVSAAPDEVPEELFQQLKEGGTLVIPVGKYAQMLKKIQKKEGKIIETDLLDVRFVPLRKSSIY
ncbi:MAG: protein-L-isoaspartate(D-aspartate) O-methyltransferase [Candidatus Marinimicrobia bacterium]|jgi:protein-L-isoaspartate(D-aspartate) O-methyltransferase|nr:protein-L-isoaspartate(D-aspartate) O-methyltransferase [Candidatus Neomarinimicrobiota bacterium]